MGGFGILNTAIRDFRDLVLWQRAMQYAKEVYLITRAFPSDERFGLTSQLRRAAVSVSSNIAEGHARQGREYAHFLSVARGSLAESESQLLLAVELGFITDDSIIDCLNIAQEIRLMSIAIAKRLPPK